MRAEQGGSTPRRNRLMISTAFLGPASNPILPRTLEGVIMTLQPSGIGECRFKRKLNPPNLSHEL